MEPGVADQWVSWADEWFLPYLSTVEIFAQNFYKAEDLPHGIQMKFKGFEIETLPSHTVFAFFVYTGMLYSLCILQGYKTSHFKYYPKKQLQEKKFLWN